MSPIKTSEKRTWFWTGFWPVRSLFHLRSSFNWHFLYRKKYFIKIFPTGKEKLTLEDDKTRINLDNFHLDFKEFKNSLGTLSKYRYKVNTKDAKKCPLKRYPTSWPGDTIREMTVNPLSANLTKWSNTLKQFGRCCRQIVWTCLRNLWDWRLKG